MCMNVFSACMYMEHMCAWCLQKSENDARASGTGVIDGYKPTMCCNQILSVLKH